LSRHFAVSLPRTVKGISTVKRRSIPRQDSLGIFICFFISGAAGLTYQVAWVKALGLIFGHTVWAIATVLAVFMAGIGAGSAYLGRWAENRGEPIVLYAYVEFLVAVTGALSFAALAGTYWLYGAAYALVSGSWPLLSMLRFSGAVIVLFVPSFLMGGTFPILVRGITRRSAELPANVSRLYLINTLGACVGTLMSGFVLLPVFGMKVTIGSAVILNTVAGLIALRVARGRRILEVGARVSAGPCRPTDQQRETSWFLFFLFAVVGSTAFAYEIAWTRLLAITISSSTYAFTVMLASFLAGSVIGSMFFERFFAPSKRVSLKTFSRTQTWTGLAALLSVILFPWILAIIPTVLRMTNQTFGGLLVAQFLTSALTVLPVSVAFGFNFPAVVVLLGGASGADSGGSGVVGKAYCVNTIGGIAGSLVAGFWLVPRLGSFRVLTIIAGVSFLIALALELRSAQRSILPLGLNALCILSVFAVGSSSLFYNRSLLSLSAVLYGNSFGGHLTLKEVAASSDLVFMEDGVNDSVAVLRSDNYVSLRINGKVDASTRDARTQLLLGHLGIGLHHAPRRVLIIGFGSGMTASAVARYPDVERIDCVEIEPAVIDAAPYLESLNRGVLNDPRIHVIFDDARSFMLTSREKYDVIISEPSNPWIAGIASLFTVEYYRSIKEHLTPDGMFVQWVQSYSLAPDDLRMIIATLTPRFLEVTLWRAETSDFLLLCRNEVSPLRFSRLHTLWREQSLRKDFDSLSAREPEGLVAYYLLDDAAVRRLATGSPLNTDDRTLLEYGAPHTMLTTGLSEANQELIAGFRAAALPSNLDPSDRQRGLEAGVITALDLNDVSNAQKFLIELEPQRESVPRHIAEGRLALMQGVFSQAKGHFEAALKLEPNAWDAMHWLAVAEHRNGEDISAALTVDRILKVNPQFLPALTDEMEFAADRKDFQAALVAQLKRMEVMGDPPAPEYCRLGAIWVKLSNAAQAEPVFLKGLAKDPYSYSCNLLIGELYRSSGQLSRARQHFEFIVRFYPDADPTIFRALAGVYVAVGDVRSANAVLRKGLRLFPTDPDLQKAIQSM